MNNNQHRDPLMHRGDRSVDDHKRSLRRVACNKRAQQPDKDALSRQISERLLSMAAYRRASTVMFYVDVRDEVRTRHVINDELAAGERKIVVPWCVDGQLSLFHLESMDELSKGAYQILEPTAARRQSPGKQVSARDLDLIVVPGVAFDRNGGRLGHGKGYYDRLLAQVRAECVLVALAYECQLFPEIPSDQHDIAMDFVVTENAIYPGSAKRCELPVAERREHR